MKKRLYQNTCEWCKKKFNPFYRSQKLCSNQCSSLWKSKETRHERTCKNCGQVFTVYWQNSIRKSQQFCSQACYINSITETTKTIKCIVCDKPFKVNFTERKRGRKFCSRRCMGRYYSQSKIGVNNPSYKDGKNKERLLERDAYRATIEYKDFIKTVFIRDKMKCVICGIKRKRIKNGRGKNNNLTVHHKKSWKDYPELRYDINNGVTLCKGCHSRVHNPKKYIEKYKGLL
jgi:hypothetical protein